MNPKSINVEDKRFEAQYPQNSRFEEIEKILKFIKEGKSVQMISIPGVGRSNLFGLLAFNRNVRIAHLGENEQTKMHFVFINLSEMRKRPLVDVTKFIFLSLVDSLRERNILEDYKKIDQIFKDYIASNDELVIFQGLKKTIDYLALEKDLTVVFLLDKFQSYLPYLTPSFFTNLRSLRDRAKYKFSVVFSLSRPLIEILESEIIEDFYEFLEGNVVYLRIEDEEGLKFRINYVQKTSGVKIDQEVIDIIKKLTGEHGKLTRICLEEYSVKQNSTQDLREFLMSKNRVQGVLYAIWKTFTPQEREILEEISNVTEIPSYLIDIQIIKNRKISIPLFQDYLKIKGEEEKNKPLVYDEDKDEIRKGETVYSNGLTSLEFKLLKFLMLNQAKIMPRDDVINAVWGDLKSTQGVTDQAIDQLIFRLRKKIEENPDSPRLVQTIKGRGLSFTQ